MSSSVLSKLLVVLYQLHCAVLRPATGPVNLSSRRVYFALLQRVRFVYFTITLFRYARQDQVLPLVRRQRMIDDILALQPETS